MKCPYCSKEIDAMTGFQELQKFQKHLRKCKKHPGRAKVVTPEGNIKDIVPNPSFTDALNIRAESGQ